jgi:hypothetical protein
MMSKTCSSEMTCGYRSGSCSSSAWPWEIITGSSLTSCVTCCDIKGTRPNRAAATSATKPSITMITASSLGKRSCVSLDTAPSNR